MTKPNPIRDYLRGLQRKASKSRWSKLTAAERSAAMKWVRAAAKHNKPEQSK